MQARISELVEPTVKKTRATVDTLAEQLDAVFAGASGDRQWGAASNAAGLKAKLLGFMREKIEIGSAGEFDQCRTTEEVIETLLAHHESPAAALAELDELRSMVEAYAANHATLVPAAEPARPVPGSEPQRSLQYLRPKRFRR